MVWRSCKITKEKKRKGFGLEQDIVSCKDTLTI